MKAANIVKNENKAEKTIEVAIDESKKISKQLNKSTKCSRNNG